MAAMGHHTCLRGTVELGYLVHLSVLPKQCPNDHLKLSLLLHQCKFQYSL